MNLGNSWSSYDALGMPSYVWYFGYMLLPYVDGTFLSTRFVWHSWKSHTLAMHGHDLPRKEKSSLFAFMNPTPSICHPSLCFDSTTCLILGRYPVDFVLSDFVILPVSMEVGIGSYFVG